MTQPAHGQLTFSADGSFTYAPDADYTKYVNDSGNLVRNIIGAYVVIAALLIFLIFLADFRMTSLLLAINIHLLVLITCNIYNKSFVQYLLYFSF